MDGEKMRGETTENEKNSTTNQHLDYKVDHKRRFYPFTIVWTPVPIISWLFPYAGHLGIGKSDGHVKDFGRPYKVLTDSNQFGQPLKYWVLNPNLAKGGIKGWDDGIEEASSLFCKKMNFVLVSNCHSHVSTALNYMQYNGRTDYNEHNLFWMFNKNFKYVNTWTFIKTWLPFTMITCTMILVILYIQTDIFKNLFNNSNGQ